MKAHFEINRDFTKYVKELYEVTKITPVGVNLRQIIDKVLREREEKASAVNSKKNCRSSKGANEKKKSAVIPKQKPRPKKNNKPISKNDGRKTRAAVRSKKNNPEIPQHSYNLRQR